LARCGLACAWDISIPHSCWSSGSVRYGTPEVLQRHGGPPDRDRNSSPLFRSHLQYGQFVAGGSASESIMLALPPSPGEVHVTAEVVRLVQVTGLPDRVDDVAS
jgi:hypothetical protein